ncbi:FAD-dependent oxidoreductase [Deferrisoma camini]|uniref:FAD-dependent oxidoreductase n=1 Tax=Deferrisoma camini TaxID=1035120 RepID=UPI00046C9BE7|nr:FAD-dependent oxidoreductase [Deferrisoma camini]
MDEALNEQTGQGSDTALVVGGGLAGMQAALVLAEQGRRVVLVEARPALGGFFPLLDNQFPTQSCGVCFMACDTPTYCPFVQCELHPNVEVVTFAAVEGVERDAEGRFRVRIAQRPTCVDPDACTDCGACEEVCPVSVPREFGDGLETRKAVFRYYPKAVGKAYVVDPDACTRCGKCVEACDPGAIDLDAEPREVVVEAGAVVLAPGADAFPASRKEELGYGRYPNVLSAVRFERMLAAGSPSSGRPVRPSDGRPPRSIAFVQCVGSRDAEGGQGHCSSVCCMFALKQALFAKERLPEAEVTVYYMDLRTFGKGYEAYLRRAEAAGIRFVRAVPSVVREVPGSRDLLLQVAGEGPASAEVPHDLVVLSTGFCPGTAGQDLLRAFGAEPDASGFGGGPEFEPCATAVPGVYLAGAFREPRDIPESVLDGARAAALAAERLGAADAAEGPRLPAPADFRGEEPRVAVVLCECEGFNTDRADFDALDRAAREVPGVVAVERVAHACSRAGLEEVRNRFAAAEANRLVLGACSHRIVEQLVRGVLRRSGFHPGLVTVANLREACLEAGGGTRAAADAVAAAVREAWYAGFPELRSESLERTVLVVGGGAAGMEAALRLAGLGLSVHLVEKEPALGGNLATSRFTLRGGDPQALREDLAARVEAHPAVKVHLGTRVEAATGRLGAFRSVLRTPEGEVELLHGAVVLATGAREAEPRSYGYGQSPRIVTQKEFEALLAEGRVPEGRVVMIQCVESREEAEGCRPWCSRVCCTHALKNARRLLDLHPGAGITVLYRDLRAYGTYEAQYRDARDRGVVFVPYDLDRRPRVEPDGERVRVRYTDPALGQEVTEEADWVVLSVGMAPDAAENARLADLYGVEVDAHGFFREKNPKAALADATRPGVYLAGLCHGPKHIEESLVHAGAAAGRCAAVVGRGARPVSENVSYVVEKICSRCGVCVEVCPYGARSLDMDENVARVDPVLCRACGACTMACPNKAAQQYGSSPKQMLMALDELLG